MSHINLVSATQADTLLSSNASAILLDTRKEEDYAICHHPRAVHLTDALLNMMIGNTPKNATIIFYSYSGNTSQDVAHLFVDLGFINCFSVNGGYSAWTSRPEAIFPLSTQGHAWLMANRIMNADINARINSDQMTPLMLAVKDGLNTIVNDLIDAGANPNLKDIQGNNALFYALTGQNMDCIKALVNADVEVENRNRFGFTALHYAICNDDVKAELSSCLTAGSLRKMHRPARRTKYYQKLHRIARKNYSNNALL
ncbi:MAG: ankyrin repeat domain-containing protein [Pseudomonadota bacterium]